MNVQSFLDAFDKHEKPNVLDLWRALTLTVLGSISILPLYDGIAYKLTWFVESTPKTSPSKGNVINGTK